MFIELECSDAGISLIIYDRVEEIHTMFTRLLFGAVLMIVAAVFAMAIMFPISYALLGHPHPSQWRLSLEIQ